MAVNVIGILLKYFPAQGKLLIFIEFNLTPPELLLEFLIVISEMPYRLNLSIKF